ncbi:MAG: ABC transporter substrate-binding protein [Nitrospira sp.]|nr:peptide ABC transporter substrate-binding protein [Candidatus Manganitrophaceae bacterium]HIL34134.1 peptide ABC transporter substrate-binding protein [Candidatus Manganitrophaceae bacterium]
MLNHYKPVYLVVLLFLSSLSGCSGSSLNNPYPKEDEALTILYSSFNQRPKHLDPAQSYSSNEITFTGQIYEPPFQYHYLKRPYTLIPLTAEDVPSPVYFDQDGTEITGENPSETVALSVYTIRIQEGIRYQPHPSFAQDAGGKFLYHNLSDRAMEEINTLSDFPETGSRELIAEDYVYQIKRLTHPKIHSPIYGFMSEYILELKAFGTQLREAQKKGSAFLDLRDFPLAGAEAVDKYTYRIKIHGKYPQFLYWLAMPFFAPVPYEVDRFYSQTGLAKKNITLDWYPVGTGPYMLTTNNPNLRMVLERNPNFHGEQYPLDGEPGDRASGILEDAGKPLPFIEKVVYSLEKEDIPIWNKFLQGYYDSSGISSDSFDQAVRISEGGNTDLTDGMKAKGIRLLTSTAASTYYMGFNMLDPVVGGDRPSARKLRQAIAIAIDQEESISIFQNGRGMAMQGPLPPGIFGFKEGEAGINRHVYDWIDGKPKRKSIAVARQLLAEAGYPQGRDAETGQPLILHFDTTGTGPEAKATFDWLRKQFEKIQVQLVIRNTDYNRFQDKMLKGTAQIFQWGWNADYPDPENFLFLLYGPNAKAGKNGENAANYSNKKFDALFEQMKNMENGPERQGIIDEMVEVFRRDVPWVSGFHPQRFGLYHAWYQNIKPNLMANNTLKYTRVDSGLRARSQGEWNRAVWWPLWVGGTVLLLGTLPAIRSYRRKERGIGQPSSQRDL